MSGLELGRSGKDGFNPPLGRSGNDGRVEGLLILGREVLGRELGSEGFEMFGLLPPKLGVLGREDGRDGEGLEIDGDGREADGRDPPDGREIPPPRLPPPPRAPPPPPRIPIASASLT